LADSVGTKDNTDNTNKLVSTDEVTRNAQQEHIQLMKIALGAENALDLVLDSAQQTMANSLPVVIASDQSALSISTLTTSIVPGTGATHLGKAEDAAHTTGDTGISVLAVRNDGGAALAGTTGDYIPLTTDSLGRLYVTGASTTQPVSIAATVSTTGTNSVPTDGSTFSSTLIFDAGVLYNYNGATWDRVRGGTTNGLFVDVKQQVPGVGATNLGKAEDAVAASGDTGVALLAVRTDTPADSTSATGDYAILHTNSMGELQIGGVANDAVDAGNPIKIGAQARATDPVAVVDADRVNILADVLGKVIQLPYAISPRHFQYAAASGGETGTGDIAIKAAGSAGIRNYITSVDAVNQHASVDTEVVIKDGATVIWRGYCRAGGGGYSLVFPTPLRGTAATAMNFANITTGSKVYLNARGYQAID